MAEKDTVMETEEKEVVSKNLLNRRLTRTWRRAYMTMSRPVSRLSPTVIYTSDMPSPYC